MSARVTTTGAPRNADERRIRRMCVDAEHAGRPVSRTPAVGIDDAEWFERHGFVAVQRLVVLRRDLSDIGSLVRHAADGCANISTHGIARHWQRGRDRSLCDTLVALDATGFAADWRLTTDALVHACRSTPIHRVVVAHDEAQQTANRIGYLVLGIAADLAYLQRLVVAPQHRTQGVATRLVAHSLIWAHTNGARAVLVNTECDNVAALALYRRMGFITQPSSLVVLERTRETYN